MEVVYNICIFIGLTLKNIIANHMEILSSKDGMDYIK